MIVNYMEAYFNTVILKVASLCNLNCTYCYEYNTGDTSWKNKPKFFSLELAKILNVRIKDYVHVSGLERLHIILHGGEPLLLGSERLDALLSQITMGITDKVRIGMQTNAVLIDESILKVLKKFSVKCGVSIDGNFFNNRNRVFHNGKSSHSETISGYSKLKSHGLVAGILCVVDFESDPREVLESLCTLAPKQIDLLQPFLNHDSSLGINRLGELFYDWFKEAYDYYMEQPKWHEIQIRLFEAALFSLISKKSNSDWFGGPHGNYMVVETDGNYDVLDHLKSLGAFGKQISNLKLNLHESSFEEANNQIHAIYRDNELISPPNQCLDCKHLNHCGGGYYPTRYNSVNKSLNNQSVYCEGLFNFFEHINYKLHYEHSNL
jgi:uncharacterized protein